MAYQKQTETTNKSDATKMAESLLELAKAAQRERKAAPMTNVGIDIRIPAKEKLKRLANTMGGQDKKWHLLFVPEKQLIDYARRGYEVVMDEGDFARNETDVCVRCPMWMYEQQNAENAARDARIRAATKQKVKAEVARTSTAGLSGDFDADIETNGEATTDGDET